MVFINILLDPQEEVMPSQSLDGELKTVLLIGFVLTLGEPTGVVLVDSSKSEEELMNVPSNLEDSMLLHQS